MIGRRGLGQHAATHVASAAFLLSGPSRVVHVPHHRLCSLHVPPVLSVFYTHLADKQCSGIQIHVFDAKLFRPVKIGWTLFDVIRKTYPEDFKINPPWREGSPNMLQYNTGCDYIQDGAYDLDELYAIIDRDSDIFSKTRERYLIY